MLPEVDNMQSEQNDNGLNPPANGGLDEASDDASENMGTVFIDENLAGSKLDFLKSNKAVLMKKHHSQSDNQEDSKKNDAADAEAGKQSEDSDSDESVELTEE